MKKTTGYYNEKIISKFEMALKDAIQLVKSGADTKVRISAANSKMGNVVSVSLLPFLTCPGCCAETCGGKCYAAKLANLRPAVVKSYAINTALVLYQPKLYWAQVNAAIAGSRFFRFHVSGDIINKAYFHHMVDCAANNPHCDILVFTKRYDVVNAWIAAGNEIPANMHILFSGWDNLQPENPHKLPETNIIPKNESSAWWDLDDTFHVCGGNCFNCAVGGAGCWNAKHGETILFPLH